ncbi:hypothetical protein MEZE111188_15935 [Mesobacillus zeae]
MKVKEKHLFRECSRIKAMGRKGNCNVKLSLIDTGGKIKKEKAEYDYYVCFIYCTNHIYYFSNDIIGRANLVILYLKRSLAKRRTPLKLVLGNEVVCYIFSP